MARAGRVSWANLAAPYAPYLNYVGGAAASASSVALPTFTAGDLALVFAYRDGFNSAPALPSGWTGIASSGANSNSSRVGYRVLQVGDTTTGTWTNATEVQVHILHGQHTTTPIGNSAAGGASSNQLSYTGFTLAQTDGTSWVVGMAGHRSATNVNAKLVSGMEIRSGGVTTLGAHTAENVSSFSTSNYASTVNASSGWRSYAVEVRAAAIPKSTGSAQISLAAGQVPATRTNHAISVRARVASGAGTIRAALYEGATNITDTAPGYLETSALTSSFVTYSLAIADADAASIGTYSNLGLRWYGYSASGASAVFEVAEAALLLPSPASGAVYGTSVSALTVTLATSGNVISSGSKATGTARLSLGSGFVPATRTLHKLVVRARKTVASGTGTIRAQVWEGTTLITTATLESTALDTTLTSYELAIPDAAAATISSYGDLEVRIWGYSSTGTALVFEVSEVQLSLPAAGTGGYILAAAHLDALAAISADSTEDIYPGTAVYPYGLAAVQATSAIAAAGASVHVGARTFLPLTFTIYSAGQIPPDRDGAALLAPVVSLAADSLHTALGAVTLASFSSVSVEAPDAMSHTDSAALAGSASITVAGTASAPPTPPVYVSYYETLPDLLAAVAFDSAPSDPFPEWTDVASYVRALSTHRGRQFELDRIETGELGATLSNLDGRFSPENTGSPYYPDLIPTKRIRVGMQWGTADPADVFNGYLEGYPQEWPAYGADSIVQQRAVDAFFTLSMTKLVPATTTLWAAMDATQTNAPVSNIALPMPQVLPFNIRVDAEEMTVTSTIPGQYVVGRGVNGTTATTHALGAVVYAEAVSFFSEYSGQRIRRVLEQIGLSASDYDLDIGETLLAASGDLAGQMPLEHINLVTEVEGGRFFAAADGRLTFQSRHHQFKNELAPRATFGDGAGELPYQDIKITHEQERIYNIVRIKSADGTVYEARDEASIADHYERVLEKDWPLADSNEARSAAYYLLKRYSRMQVRIPELKVSGQKDPDLLWPYLIALEIGQRFRVIRRPSTTSPNIEDAEIDKELIVEGIAHSLSPGRAETTIQLSLADTTHYWRLGVAGYSELGTSTRLVY